MANLSCLSYPRNNKKEKTDLVMQKSAKIKNTYPCIFKKNLSTSKIIKMAKDEVG
jgi:hypothetical protein